MAKNRCHHNKERERDRARREQQVANKQDRGGMSRSKFAKSQRGKKKG